MVNFPMDRKLGNKQLTPVEGSECRWRTLGKAARRRKGERGGQERYAAKGLTVPGRETELREHNIRGKCVNDKVAGFPLPSKGNAAKDERDRKRTLFTTTSMSVFSGSTFLSKRFLLASGFLAFSKIELYTCYDM